jgi:hypothetical protein
MKEVIFNLIAFQVLTSEYIRKRVQIKEKKERIMIASAIFALIFVVFTVGFLHCKHIIYLRLCIDRQPNYYEVLGLKSTQATEEEIE